MITIACVLRSGGDFAPIHVAALARGLAAHMREPYRLVCLSDLPRLDVAGVTLRPLVHAWPGWWAKLEMFRDGSLGDRGELLQDPVLYLDLDCIVVGDLAPLAVVGADFGAWPDPNGTRTPWGAVMSFFPQSAASALYREFLERGPEQVMFEERGGSDQTWIARRYPAYMRLDAAAPGAVRSWRLECANGIPAGTRLIGFHGRPRPWDSPLADLWWKGGLA